MEGEHIQIPVSPKVKPALKHPAKTDSAAPVDLDTKGKHLTWDERAIEEHDVLRGTRMKVSEISLLGHKQSASASLTYCTSCRL